MKTESLTPFLRAGLLGLAMSLIYGCGSHEEPAAATTGGRTVTADTLTVQPSAVGIRVESPGTVVSEDQVQVASRLMGYIREIKVKEGQSVKAGQLLFVVDPTDIQGQVGQARAGLA